MLIVVPPLGLWALVQLFGLLPQVTVRFPTSDYLTFITPAYAVAAVLPVGMLSSAALLTDRASGLWEQMLATPVPRLSLLVSEFLVVGSIAMTSTLLLLLLGVMAGLPVRAGLLGILAILFLSLLLSLVYSGFSLAFTMLTSHQNLHRVGGTLLVFVSFFVSDLILPASFLPSWLVALAQANPLFYAIRGARDIVWSAPSWSDYGRQTLVLALLAILCVTFSTICYHHRVEAS